MTANGAGKEWKKLVIISIDDFWQTADGEIICSISALGTKLIFMSKDQAARNAQSKADAERRALEGF